VTARNTSGSLSFVSSDDSAVDLELLAASLRADTSDLTAFVESLAAKLEEAVPSRTKVERRRSGMFGPKAVRRISSRPTTGSQRSATPWRRRRSAARRPGRRWSGY
jgi:hypothetical protein